MQQKTNTIKTKTKHNKKENEPHQINQQNNNKKKTNIFFATMVRWSCLLFYDFQFLPQSKQVTNSVAGSSALLVCIS